MLTLCPGCFEQEAPVEGENCPQCGYAPSQDRLPLSLPIQTELKGRYVVGRVLGEPGGFGVTYLSYDRLQEKRVAIKEYMPREVAGRDTDGVSVVPHSGKGSDEFEYGKEQFLGEAKTLARFDHANIVSVQDFFEGNGTAYLVMEYYEGKPLDKYLEEQAEGRMDPEVATKIMLRVLDGLKEIHAEAYLHRDVKPENIYLTAEGRPILIDFGAARQAMGERSRSLSVVMTEGYAPYEQYSRQGNQGPHTDVYGCGATLYRMITGQKPPPATDRVMEDRLEEPRNLNPEVPQGLSQVIVEALTMGDEERIPTAGAFQDRLRAGLRGEIAPPSSKEREPTAGEQSADVSPDRASVGPSNDLRGDPSGSPSPASETTQPRKENVEDRNTSWSTVAIGALIVMALGLGGIAVALYPSSEENVAQTTERQTTEQSGTEESGSDAGGDPSTSGEEEQTGASQFLQAARGHLEAGRLTKPDGANALAAVRQALDRNPGSKEAQRLLGRIAARLAEKGNAVREAGNLTAAADFYERSLEIENRESVRKSLETVRSRIQKQKRVERLLSEVRSTLNQESPSASELKEAQRQVKQVLTLDADNRKASALKERVASRIATREAQTREETVLRKGLVAYYPFEGTAQDKSGNGHDGTLFGDPRFVDGIDGRALSLDGDNDYVSIRKFNSIPTGDDEFTISAWIYLVNYRGDRSYTISSWGRYGCCDNMNLLRTKSDGGEGYLFSFYGLSRSEDVRVDYNIPSNKWFNVTVTYDGSIVRVYQNGDLVINKRDDAKVYKSNISIGKNLWNNKGFLYGNIDEFRIYNLSLSSSEVKSLFRGFK